MPKSRNQKLKILYIRDYLLSHTDENTGVTVGEIIDRLASLGITAERKSVYEDIAQLTDVYGDDIMVCRNGKRHEYRMMSREFETPELRLLTDAVQASKFVTQKKSSQLISKLKTTMMTMIRSFLRCRRFCPSSPRRWSRLSLTFPTAPGTKIPWRTSMTGAS